MKDNLDDVIKRLLQLEKKLEKYYSLLLINNELDFILKGNYILDEVENILQGNY